MTPQNTIILSLCFAVLLSAPLGLRAESTEKLTLHQALKLAEQRSENIEIAKQDLIKAQAQIKEAYASAYPSISASVRSTRHLESPVLQIGSDSIPIKQDWELNMNLQISQVVYAFGRIGTAVDLAKVFEELSEKNLEATMQEIRYQVKVSYYNVLVSERLVKIAEQSLTNAEKNKKILQNRFKSGRIPQFDNIKIDSDIASRKPTVSDAKKQLTLAYLRLNLLLGLDINKTPKLVDSLPTKFSSVGSFEQLSQQALKVNPQLKIAELSAQAADKQYKLANAERYPTLAAFGSIDRSGTGTEPEIGSENITDSSAIGLTLSIPLWQGGAISARQSQALAEKRKAELQQTQYKEKIQLDLQTALSKYKADIETYNSLKQAVHLAQQTYNLMVNRYKTGGVTQKDLNDAELLLTGKRMQLEATLLTTHQAKAEIEKLMNEVK